MSAGDGEHWVTVWQTKNGHWDHDIAGAAVDAEGVMHPFTIGVPAVDEVRPVVIVAGKGLFVVAYEIEAGDRRLIAGRYLSFLPPHPHAVGK